MIWQSIASELIRGGAYACVALALCNLFREPDSAALGGRRWVLAGLPALAAATQLAVLAAALSHHERFAHNASLLTALLLLLTAAGFWPLLAQMRNRHARAMNARLQDCLDGAAAEARESRRGLEMAESIAHIGHWRYRLADDRFTWSDEVYRIHGLQKGAYTPRIETIMDHYHPDDRATVGRKFHDTIRHQSNFEIAVRLLRADGQTRHVISHGFAQLNAEGRVVSVFGVLMDVTEQRAAEDRLREAKLLTDDANKMLREMSMVDSLTGLGNRRHFDAALETEFKRAIREQTGLGLIMIDLDHFKGFNDLYGHPAGDECLRLVARAIARVPKRPSDLSARYGGEEFVVLLPNTDRAGSLAVAVQIAAAVTALALPHAANDPPIATISAGVAVFEPGRDAHVLVELIERADQALYRAKRAGRQRVICHAHADEAEAAEAAD